MGQEYRGWKEGKIVGGWWAWCFGFAVRLDRERVCCGTDRPAPRPESGLLHEQD